jgi:putative colanic acid biosynthesis UDP-glucose lipid carrier transferase
MMKNSHTLYLTKSAAEGEHNVLRHYVDSKSSYLFLKRFFDILFSSLFLLFVGTWLFPVIALLIAIDSRGPILFLQKRVGRGGKTFRCVKFRTMITNDDADIKQAEADDYRITRIGHFLRTSSLDELPQFWNVLAGQMSVVGPRPHMHADCVRFSFVVDEYKFRNFVKPGITGLAQVKGFRGPTSDFGSVFHRYQYDAFYVRNCNFWLDMRIIRKTAVQTLVFIYSKLTRRKVRNVFIDAEEIEFQVRAKVS